MYDLGDTITLSWVSGGNFGNATLAVTNPNGVVTTVNPVVPSGGTYTATYVTAVAGRHTVLWTTATEASQDVFEVRPQSPLALASIADAASWLRLSATDAANEADKLQTLLEASAAMILYETGPMMSETHTEFFDGGVPQIVPAHQPIISVTSLDEFYGQVDWHLTEQPLGAQHDAYGFTVDYVSGQITRRTFGGGAQNFVDGVKNVKLVYVGGRPQVPENVVLANRELVKHLYQQTQTPGRPGRRGAGGDIDGELLAGYALPNFVVDLLKPHLRPPGIA